MVPGPSELRAVEQQFAVFTSVCATANLLEVVRLQGVAYQTK
jgi:hypothetical protein